MLGDRTDVAGPLNRHFASIKVPRHLQMSLSENSVVILVSVLVSLAEVGVCETLVVHGARYSIAQELFVTLLHTTGGMVELSLGAWALESSIHGLVLNRQSIFRLMLQYFLQTRLRCVLTLCNSVSLQAWWLIDSSLDLMTDSFWLLVLILAFL
jgi:hypothetical protein